MPTVNQKGSCRTGKEDTLLKHSIRSDKQNARCTAVFVFLLIVHVAELVCSALVEVIQFPVLGAQYLEVHSV